MLIRLSWALLNIPRRLSVIGETSSTPCGMKVTVVKTVTIGRERYVVAFEDGIRVSDVKPSDFRRGAIHHPGLRNGSGVIAGFRVKKISRTENTVYYKCTCQKCKEEGKEVREDILTPQDMIKHYKENHDGKSK